jgi:hypothetical protein
MHLELTTETTLVEQQGTLIERIDALTAQVNALTTMLDTKFITREELQKTLLDKLTEQASARFDRMDSEGERRHTEFVKHYEERLETLASKSEVEEIKAQLPALAPVEKLDILRTDLSDKHRHYDSLLGGHGEALDELKTRLSKMENTIETGVAAVARNSSTMNRTVARWLKENKDKEDKNDLEFKSLNVAKIEFEKQIRQNREETMGLLGSVDGLRGDIATKVTTTDLKVTVIKTEMENVKAQQSALTKDLTEIQVSLQSALWLVNTWAGRSVLVTILGLLIGSNLIR